MIKKIVKYVLVLAASLAAISCNKPAAPESDILEVTANNISGKWELVSMDGSEVLEGSFLHVEFIRNDTKFIISDGMQGFHDAPKTSEGKFHISYVEGKGDVIEGLYDHSDNQFWNEKYVISDLTADRMTFTGLKSGSVQVFERMPEDN